MSETQIAQIAGAIIGAVIAVAIAGIARMLNSSEDADF